MERGMSSARAFRACFDMLDNAHCAKYMGLYSGNSLAKGLHHRVYNFEVARHHTYIADDTRVHNTSVLSFLNPHELQNIDIQSLDDTNNDGAFDYVEINETINGLAAGTTVYKLESDSAVRGYKTYTDERGRLVQLQYVRDAEGNLQQRLFELNGAEFGEKVGRFVTPFLTSAILGDDATVFEKIASNTIIGTLTQNAFEFAGGYIHDQIVSGGLQNASLEPIADHTFSDLTDDFISNAIDNSQAALTSWILAEVFESVNTDQFGGKLAYLLANQGVNYIVDLTLHQIATDVLELRPDQIAKWGLEAPDLAQTFSGGNILNLVFKATIGTILPELESTEAQIGSGLITIALDVFAGIGGIVGSVLGYLGGRILDLLFDKDPEAFAHVTYAPFVGQLELLKTTSDDGGNKAVATGMAQAYVDFINEVVERAQSTSHNLAELAQTMNLVFGYHEEHFRNGDGRNYSDAKQAITARISETVKALELKDGDVKFAIALSAIADSTSTSPEAILDELSLRMQVAADYQVYLENKGFYDSLIAADPESAFAAGWTTTFILARQYGYAEDFSVTGDDSDNLHFLSSGNDFVNSYAGDDEIHGYGGDDVILAGDGNDTLFGGAGNDTLEGGDGDDEIFGGAGDNVLKGGSGIDQFYIADGNNTVDGGSDEDLAIFKGAIDEYQITDKGDNEVDVSHSASGFTTKLKDVEFLRFYDTVRTFDPSYDNFLVGTASDDILNGTNLRDAINGLAGDDIIYGFDGDDFLSGDDGDDQIFGGAGDDWIFGVLGNDILHGGPGNDPIFGGEHADYIWGGSGNDRLYGEEGGDVLNGGDGDDILEGRAGDDLLEGAAGSDTLIGQFGDDSLFGGDGIDRLEGNWGDDYLDGGNHDDYLHGGHGDDVVHGGDGDDTLFGINGDDVLYGGAGSDQIFGGWGSDIAYGGDGDDNIFALHSARPHAPFYHVVDLPGISAAKHYSDWGADIAYGGAGNDRIALNDSGSIGYGGTGNDVIFVLSRQVHASGGEGYDIVRFQATNSQDAVWYRSASGTIGAKVWDTNTSGQRIGWNSFNLFVDVEKIQSEKGESLLAGYSFNNGYGNPKHHNPRWTGFNNVSDAEFQQIFAPLYKDEVFLSHRIISNPDPKDPSDVNEVTINIANWEQLGNGADTIEEPMNGINLHGGQRIRAGGGNDTIDGGEGNDQLDGQAGNDRLDGGTGSDTLYGGDGADTLIGGSGADVVHGGGQFDTIYLGEGNDLAYGGWGNDRIEGQSGGDVIYGGYNHDKIFGGSGRDELYGEYGNDLIYGGDDPDVIEGNDGSDTIYGDDGGDYLSGGYNDDMIFGGRGVDKIEGGNGNDTLHGDQASDEIYGGFGFDQIFGGSGSDNLYGENGDDILSGDDGNDSLEGGAGNDTLIGGNGADLFDGGDGVDLADYFSATSSVSVNLLTGFGSLGEAAGDKFVGIEKVRGSGFNDEIIGNDASNSLRGASGNDTLNGGGGDDALYGGDGADRLSGGTGNDVVKGDSGDDLLFGGAGDDILNGWNGRDTLEGGDGADSLLGGADADNLSGGSGDDTVQGDAGDDILKGGDGDDVLWAGDGDDLAQGGTGNDSIQGGDGSDHLSGGAGMDTLAGGDQNDVLDGGVGNDTLSGENGADILSGGIGDDILIGGGGADVFVFSGDFGNDIIEDFTASEVGEVIDLSGVLSIESYADLRSNHLSQQGVDALIDDGTGNTIVLRGINVTTLTADNFFAGGSSNVAAVTTINGTVSDDLIDGSFVDADGESVDDSGQIILGGDGKDKIYDGAGDDTVDGGSGHDYFYAGGGADEYIGGADRDIVYYTRATSGLTIDTTDATNNTGIAAGDTFLEVERLYGSDFDDDLTWNGKRLYAGAGDDTLRDTVETAEFFGGSGDDLFVMAFDGTTDRIFDFKGIAAGGDDRIDLQAWGVSSIDQLAFNQRYTGAGTATGETVIEFGGEYLRVKATWDSGLDQTVLVEGDFVFI